MKKHKKYRIIGVITILLLVLSVSLLAPTYAEEVAGETTENLTCIDLAEKYGLYVEKGDGENEYIVIKDNSVACGVNAGIAELQVVAVNDITVTDGPILKAGQETAKITAALLTSGSKHYVKVTLKNVADENERIDVEYALVQEPTGGGVIGVESNIHYSGLCATFRANAAAAGVEAQIFYKDSLNYCWQQSVTKGTNYTTEELQKKIDKLINLWGAYNNQNIGSSQSFLQLFEEAKNKAINAGNVVSKGSDVENNTFDLKCNYQYVKKADPSVTYTNKYGDVISATDYYLNKDYYYSSETVTDEQTVTYTYNYAIGNAVQETSKSCEKTCEESVKVEYGPPVASKAGLCFQYKVKVTSYVKCSSKFVAEPPKTTTAYCSPAPKCTSLSGVIRKKPQAGPTQEFDSCIQTCDGGEYTQACSLKCYEEVYGNNSTVTELALNYSNAPAKKLAQTNTTYSLKECLEDNKDYYGCYGYSSSKINWYSNVNYDSNGNKLSTQWNNIYGLGRWYLDRVYGGPNTPNYDYNSGGYNITGISSSCTQGYCGSYIADDNGFYRRNNNGSLCSDNCEWQTNSCGRDQYLNPGSAIADVKRNQDAYEEAKVKCIASATCSEKTAEFTIAIKYDTADKDGNITVNKIYFPYSDSSLKKNPTEGGDEYKSLLKSTLTGKGTTNPSNDDTSVVLDYAGCYKNQEATNTYMTEWSFPGTYIHNKTGDLSFKVPGDSSGWHYENDKFCMPLNAESVNSKWWEWNKVGSNNSCYTTAEIEEELKGKTGTSNGYNIEAIAEEFGYFGWNFNIKCFYALRNEVCEIDEETMCCKEPEDTCEEPPCDTKTNGVSNYVVRTVDRENLFPNAKIVGVVDEEKRDIGFNWTKAAKITSTKNAEYIVDPEALIANIQNNANNIYSDGKYLDYQFYLTPATLKEIRKYNETNNYGEWNGETIKANGIRTYSSNLFRGASAILTEGNGAVLKTGTQGVNNENFPYIE